MPLQLLDSGANRNLTTLERLELSRAVGGLPLTVSHVTAIPLDASYVMAPHTVAGALTFTASSPTVGGRCVLRLTANGTNIPTFPGTKVGAGSYVNTAGIVNVVTVWSLDGAGSFHSIEQAGAAVAAVPAAPTIGTATAGNGNASVTFTPGADGGSAILDYQITASTGQTATVSGSPGTITVPNGTAATFTVRARNAIGYGPNSAASNSVTPSAGITAPGAPTGATATAGDGTVSVAFTAPASNGGATITGYRVTLSTGQTATGSASPISVTAPNGTAVTATVAATNSVGYGAESSASNSVTPAAASYVNVRLTSLTLLSEGGDATAGWTYTGTKGTSGYGCYGISVQSIPANAAGFFEWNQGNPTRNIALGGLKAAGTAGAKATIGYGIQPLITGSARYLPVTNGVEEATLAPPVGPLVDIVTAAGPAHRMRIGRYDTGGGTFAARAHVSTDSGATWTMIREWLTVGTGQWWFGMDMDNLSTVQVLRGVGVS